MIVSKFTNLNEWKLGRSHIVCKIVKMFIHPPCVTNQKVSAWTYVILFRHLFILNRKIETQVDGRIICFVFINGTRVSIYIYIYIFIPSMIWRFTYICYTFSNTYLLRFVCNEKQTTFSTLFARIHKKPLNMAISASSMDS